MPVRPAIPPAPLPGSAGSLGPPHGEALESDALGAAVARFLRYLATERRASSHTTMAYQGDLEQLLAHVRTRRRERGDARPPGPRDVDVLALRGWLGELARTHAPPSVARKIAAARAFFRYLVRRGEADKSPAAEL